MTLRVPIEWDQDQQQAQHRQGETDSDRRRRRLSAISLVARIKPGRLDPPPTLVPSRPVGALSVA
ncbi:hypothetical protein, partial [Klebsiella pneumoniae]|uniref:hypothetical protein n=1 Tax=Klebsiella pneumoniae TaxID=573 RepID=UPI0013D48D80